MPQDFLHDSGGLDIQHNDQERVHDSEVPWNWKHMTRDLLWYSDSGWFMVLGGDQYGFQAKKTCCPQCTEHENQKLVDIFLAFSVKTSNQCLTGLDDNAGTVRGPIK